MAGLLGIDTDALNLLPRIMREMMAVLKDLQVTLKAQNKVLEQIAKLLAAKEAKE